MRTLHRYLIREMMATVAMAVGVCTGLLLLGNLLKEILALLMSGQATLGLVFRSIGLLVPFVLSFALPMGALTAALLVFGRLSADSELTAARANGISLMALAMPVIALSLAICGLCAWINLDVAPRCRVAYKSLFTEIARDRARALLPAGRFVTDFPGYVLYANRVEGDSVEGVLCFQMKDGRKISDIRAPSARLELLSDQRKVRLTFVEPRALHWMQASPTPVETNGNALATSGADPLEPEGTWVPLTMGEEVVEIPLPPAIVSGGLPALSDMTWRQLLVERNELRKLGVEEATPLDVQLHRQVAFSFASFGFALVGIPLGVRAHRRETSVGIAFAILLVLLYYAFLIVAQALETRPESAPWLIVWLPNILFQFAGGWLLWRANRG